MGIIKETVRKLRKNQTPTEEVLWEKLRNRKLLGKKFTRQYPISLNLHGTKQFFVVDFYCHEARLAIELDGGIHKNRKIYDKLRDDLINRTGIRLVRFNNDKIISNIDDVLSDISKFLEVN